MWSEAKHMANYTITEEFGRMIFSYVYYFQSLIGPQQEASCEGGEAVTSRRTCTFRHMPWWPLTIISSLYEVFYRER